MLLRRKIPRVCRWAIRAPLRCRLCARSRTRGCECRACTRRGLRGSAACSVTSMCFHDGARNQFPRDRFGDIGGRRLQNQRRNTYVPLRPGSLGWDASAGLDPSSSCGRPRASSMSSISSAMTDDEADKHKRKTDYRYPTTSPSRHQPALGKEPFRDLPSARTHCSSSRHEQGRSHGGQMWATRVPDLSEPKARTDNTSHTEN